MNSESNVTGKVLDIALKTAKNDKYYYYISILQKENDLEKELNLYCYNLGLFQVNTIEG